MAGRRDLEVDLERWFARRMPSGWTAGAPSVRLDREEILVIAALAPPEMPSDLTAQARRAALAAHVETFRTETREHRVRVASDAEQLFGRSVSWGARCGEVTELFTMVSVPVMTRLRMPERAVLDTLVNAGVARSRSDALAWCVRLVGKHQGDWIEELRDALKHVERARAAGPE